MSFSIKGTKTAPTDGPSLCQSCSHAQIMHGSRPSESVTYCMNFYNGPVTITWHITSCNNYDNAGSPSLREMERIAWRFSADRASKKMGFQTPAQYRAAHPED